MLRLFYKNIGLQTLLVLAAAVALWLPALASPVAALVPDGSGVLYTLLVGWMAPLAAVITALVLVATEGMMLNLLLVRAGLTPQTSLLPTLLFVLAMASSATTLTPLVLVCGTMIAFCHCVMIRGTLLTIPVGKICAATAMVSLGTLFYLPSAMMLAAYLLMAVSYRLYSWRDWAAMLLGLLAPYIGLATVAYLAGTLPLWWEQTVAAMASPALSATLPATPTAMGNAWLAVLLVAALMALLAQLGEHPVVWQKNALAVVVPAVGGALMLLYRGFFPIDMQLFAIPFALCVMMLMLPPRPAARPTPAMRRRVWAQNLALIATIVATAVC